MRTLEQEIESAILSQKTILSRTGWTGDVSLEKIARQWRITYNGQKYCIWCRRKTSNSPACMNEAHARFYALQRYKKRERIKKRLAGSHQQPVKDLDGKGQQGLEFQPAC